MIFPDPQLEMIQAAGLSFLTDEQLFQECGIRMGFTNRHGGFSDGSFASLNLGANTSDSFDNVCANRDLLKKAIGATDIEFVYPKQVHGDEVVYVSSAADLDVARECAELGADGVLVRCAGIAPLLCFADCVPVVIVSSDCFAVVHAGWRGVMARIAPKAVKMMMRELPDLKAENINVYIGPHIGRGCFEVSEDLYASFVSEFGEACGYSPRHVDLSSAIASSLEELGVLPSRIVDANICTVCNNDDYFSYRAQDGDCGRHSAFCFRKE